MHGKSMNESTGDIQISFGYQCAFQEKDPYNLPKGIDIPSAIFGRRNNSSFCLSGAALSANATLANTNICNGLIGAEILPTLDSPNSFRRIPSSPSFSKLDFLSSSHGNVSNLSCSPSTPSELHDYDSFSPKSSSTPKTDGFLNTTEVEVAGGAAGEDRVQAVCSEENGWLFCGIYDGFNGRDAADFLAGTLYETIGYHLNLLDMELEQELLKVANGSLHHLGEPYQYTRKSALVDVEMYSYADSVGSSTLEIEKTGGSYKERVLSSLQNALNQAENDFLHMVEQEMDDRPDLVSIGSCVLVALLLGQNLYLLNIGDSRAVLATYDENSGRSANDGLIAVQLSEIHSVDNEDERTQLLRDHPDDPSVIYGGKVKGKLKVTRALGVGYLKKKLMNDALMGILRVRNLVSPPYISVQPSLKVHEISNSDLFVVLGSDGLFDFFTNEEVVKLVHSYISSYPNGDPAKYLVEQLLIRAANSAGFTIEELQSIPAGRRRKYHDDITVMVIILGMNKRTLKASTRL
ncbi:OLC1v1020396C1 [Oldenlandia corymbosa var. corymbosa]|uniref:OLC1v1020396C1 n=1 Tax=Oldenlandia corymbosa var. corymbosa TaxID=529605 RepID=A0AAV1EGU8_OLDCO|nr:OLC1v1020396C1 [Oldenlandia corymbosa var. corymbosa]